MIFDPRPIGIFDSGIGGLTVFAAIKRALPQESLVYLGDTARVPYGNKSPETVVRYALEDAAFLMKQGVKAIVVACNTVSAYALPVLQEKLKVPVIGVIEPGAEAAAASSKVRHIGVIGTTGTIASNAYTKALHHLDPNIIVTTQACPLFVPLVEDGWLNDEPTRLIAHRYLDVFQAAKIDTLVLGCTHYPLLTPLIQEVVGTHITLIDSAEATARALKLHPQFRATGDGARPTYRIAVTDMPKQSENVAKRFFGNGLPPMERV
ncbi:MAG: glutamate racemase [Deltaproteobacteria bacterium]|nr:glutamate racemase [Deltaproteobacteria bacterium]